jgi:hypothetical protein
MAIFRPEFATSPQWTNRQSAGRVLIEHDDLIQTFLSNGANDSFDAPLSWRGCILHFPLARFAFDALQRPVHLLLKARDEVLMIVLAC